MKGIFFNMFVTGVNSFPTQATDNGVNGMLGGQVIAGANSVYLQGLGDINLIDNGFDIMAIPIVTNMTRTNGTGALNASWMAIRPQSKGTVAVDSFYSGGGPVRMAIDLTGVTLQDLAGVASNAAIATKAGMLWFGNATNATTTRYSNTTSLGTESFGYDATSGWNSVVGGASILSANATAITASKNLIRKAATADQSADVYVATTAGSRTIPNGCSWECLTPTATIATFATTMPAAPIDKQEVWISTTNTITTWTLSPNTGQTDQRRADHARREYISNVPI